MYKKLLFRSKPTQVVLVLLFLTLNAFSFKSSGFSSPTFSQSTSTIRQEPVKHSAAVNSKKHYYKNAKGERVQSPTHYTTTPAGACAICRDGTYSFSRNHRGACSHQGGVKKWLN
jgi:hypothetical protein